MRMKNKMKDFEVESEEGWEVAEEYFAKELEKNLVQYKANERNLKYKLKDYQKYFSNFICFNPTSIEVSCHNEKTKARTSGTTQEEEIQIEESLDLRSGTIHEEVQPEIPQDLRKGGQEEKKPKGIHEHEKVEAFPTPEKEISKIQHLDIKPQTKLVGEEIGNVEQKVDIKPLVYVQIRITTLWQGKHMFIRI